MKNHTIGGYDMYQYWVCRCCSHMNAIWLYACEQCNATRYELYGEQSDVYGPIKGWNSSTTTYYYPLGWKCPNCGTIHNPETKMCFCNKKKEAVNEHGEWETIED